MPLLDAAHLYRYYGKYCAVNNLSFHLHKGDVLGLLGQNGAGKTTTLQMLCGVLAPSAGQIQINGFDLLKHPLAAKQHMGYLPDTPPLYRDLTVTEYLTYCAKLHGLNKHATRLAMAHVIERCGLISVSKRLIAHLSKGFQQRLGIAQAILHQPDIIILDEPTVGLDPLQMTEIRALIRELGQEHGIILSTHRLSEVQESCNQVHIIHQGKLLLNESIAALDSMMDTGVIQITTRFAVDNQRLAAIAGITQIETLAENCLRVHFNPANNPTQALTETIMAAGWELQELIPIKKSLEDIFIALTQDKTL